ncbi:hypothetical protein Ob7_06693 [Thermosipho africanus Ob7]|jgi:hypothetical protein|uniref:hypothetical protein n=1 Tax=Thermosipho africanus TaxID=2421 RepID=UPI000E0B2234|nr:hypothetical protein [Thermosipho africanus]RDI91128.1 hypothetical protein Ob7_06693 [Thermosipho africanus Ob7]
MESSVLLLRLNEENNNKLNEIMNKLKEITNITKAKMYFLAGAYGYFYDKREKIQDSPIDVTRVEFLERSEYKVQKILLNSIYHSQKENLDENINKYKLFEEYANAGVRKLYDIFTESSDIEEFIESLELEVIRIIEALGISTEKEEEEKNEQI